MQRIRLYGFMGFDGSSGFAVYTPGEFQTLVENPSVGFWQSVVREIKRIL